MTTPSRTLAHVGRCFLGLLLLGTAGGCESGSSNAATPSALTEVVGGSNVPSSAPAVERVEVTSAGFQPSRVDAGTGRALVFRRTTDKTCATSVVFPALGIEKPLPLNTDVAVDLPPGTTGELAFQCGMGMDRGKVIVR
jgi:hypothetical protein